MKKTILVLSHVGFDNTPYCSYVHSHAQALRKLGYNVIVLASLRWFPFISMLKKQRKEHYKKFKGEKIIDDVKVIYFKSLSVSNFLKNSKININGFFYYLASRKKIKNIIKQDNVVLIDAHTFKNEGYVAAKLRTKYNIPAIVTCHGTSFYTTFKTKNGKELIKNIAQKLDYLICVSERFKEKLDSINVKNTKVIYNGINTFKKMDMKKKEERNYYGIVTLGTLKEQKNINIVIEAFKEIYKENKTARLTIIGKGPLKEKLIKMCEVLEINQVVKFEGQITNKKVYEIMRKNNIFVLPSVREGFGICYAEAMYNGCITIGTKGEGIDGFIKDKENGFLIHPSAKEVSEAIRYIMNNKEKCEEIREKGKKVAADLTWDRNAFEYEKIIINKEEHNI